MSGGRAIDQLIRDARTGRDAFAMSRDEVHSCLDHWFLNGFTISSALSAIEAGTATFHGRKVILDSRRGEAVGGGKGRREMMREMNEDINDTLKMEAEKWEQQERVSRASREGPLTIEEVKAERLRLEGDLQRVLAPVIESFEARTGVVANVRTDHADVTTFSDSRRRFKVGVRVVLDWEA